MQSILVLASEITQNKIPYHNKCVSWPKDHLKVINNVARKKQEKSKIISRYFLLRLPLTVMLQVLMVLLLLVLLMLVYASFRIPHLSVCVLGPMSAATLTLQFMPSLYSGPLAHINICGDQ